MTLAYDWGWDGLRFPVSGGRRAPFASSAAYLTAAPALTTTTPVSPAGTSTNKSVGATPAWIASLGDAVLKADLTAIATSGSATEAQLAKVFSDLAANLKSTAKTLTAGQFADLKSIVANLGSLGASSYVQYIANALVYGNVANQTFTGGGAAVALGNLATGASATKLSQLSGKWFLGTDDPASAVSMSGANFSVNYKTTSLPLFGANGPVASDINQGYLGDCYLLSSLAEVAAENPSVIRNMIADNGNGTYGVRFHFGGHDYYVTVDSTLPNGGTIFNSGTAAWASLIEKAYAELPTTGALLGQSTAYSNSFSSIGNGGDPTAALEEITGATSLTEFAANGTNWLSYGVNASENWNGAQANLSTASALSALAADLAIGSDLVLTSWTNAKDSAGKTTLVASHALSVYGFDASTGLLEIRNPWGTYSVNQSWDTTFEINLGTLLSAGDSIVADNLGLATSVAATSVVAAAGLQLLSQVTSFSVSDTVAHVSAALSVLGAESKLSSLTINGTGGADTINLTGFSKSTVVSLGADADSAKLTGAVKAVAGVSSASALNLGTTGSYDLATLGMGSDTVAYTLGSGVLDVVGFSAAHDLLSINLGGASLLQTIVGGSDWISSSTDISHGVLLAGIASAQKVTISGSVATVV